MVTETTFEIIKMLFEKHSKEFADRRAKIHTTTEKYITLIMVLFTAINSQIVNITFIIKIIFSATMIIVMSVVLFVIYKDNKVSLTHAKVVNRINNELGLWTAGKMQTSLYDNKWRNFGYEKSLKGILHHIIVIFTITVALIISLFLVES